MALRLQKGAGALALLALFAACAFQGTLARTLAGAPAPAPAAEEPGSSLVPAPAPALNLTVDDGAALWGPTLNDLECKGRPACECGLAKGEAKGCLARCSTVANRIGYDDIEGPDPYFRYLEECNDRCYEALEYCSPE